MVRARYTFFPLGLASFWIKPRPICSYSSENRYHTFQHTYKLSRYYLFTIKQIICSLILKWRLGGKIWYWYIILRYFAEYLTRMLTFGPHSNLVLDLKMWEKFESNLPLCYVSKYGYILFSLDFLLLSMIQIWLQKS